MQRLGAGLRDDPRRILDALQHGLRGGDAEPQKRDGQDVVGAQDQDLFAIKRDVGSAVLAVYTA